MVTNRTVSLTAGAVADLTVTVPVRLEPIGAVVPTVTATFTLKVAPGSSTGVVKAPEVTAVVTLPAPRPSGHRSRPGGGRARCRPGLQVHRLDDRLAWATPDRPAHTGVRAAPAGAVSSTSVGAWPTPPRVSRTDRV